jgi:chromosome segregation ATPase
MEKKLLPYLVVISALSVSLSAAFYSVTGLGKMFSGASVQVMIMMSSLEIAKLVLASLLYQYWSRLNRALKIYYFIALFVLMSITSAGIYGYLSSAYSDTLNKVETIDKQVKVLDTKREMFQTQLTDLRAEKERLNQNIAELTKGASNNYVQTKDSKGNIITTSSSANRKLFDEQLKSSQKTRDDLAVRETALNDSITKIDLKKLELETNDDVAAEVGPLKYIAKLTNKSMDQVINWFIIALMLVFDPLAVSLVVGANVIFRDKEREKEKLKLSQDIDQKLKDFELRESEIQEMNSDFETRLQQVENLESETIKKLKDLEDEQNKIFSQKETELNSRQAELENIDLQIKKKYDEISRSLENKESQFEQFVLEEKTKLDTKQQDLDTQELDLQNKMKNYKDLILKEEQQYKVKLESQEMKLKEEIQKFKEDKHKFSELKKKILDDQEELQTLESRLSQKQEELDEKESILEKVKDELVNLDNEIRDWESKNFKMRRLHPPPSRL